MFKSLLAATALLAAVGCTEPLLEETAVVDQPATEPQPEGPPPVLVDTPPETPVKVQ